MTSRAQRLLWVCTVCAGLAGCQWFVTDADREVYRLIEKRQLQAIGETSSVQIDSEFVPSHVPKEAYRFVPHPVDAAVPAEFATTQPVEGAVAQSQPAGTKRIRSPLLSESQSPQTRPADPENGPTSPLQATLGTDAQPAGQANSADSEMAATSQAQDAGDAPGIQQTRVQEDNSRKVMTLSEVLQYAFAHSRAFQTAKEDLYLAALALTLERHLWTPQFNGSIGAEYANYGAVRDFDHAMASVAQVGLEQRLPLGGTVTARVINELMRDLTNHITTGETGQAVLEANIPLLRGAGLVAYESRFQAERNLIYAVRTFETFRRALAVDIAGDYFSLQQRRQQVLNDRESTKSLRLLADRSRAWWRTGRVIQLEVQRAEQEVATAENREVDDEEQYRTALDQFKIRIGMPTVTPIDVALPEVIGTTRPAEGATAGPVSLEEALVIPTISEEAAIAAGLKYRLDLLNQLDGIDDAARGVNVAENNLLPDLNASGSVVWNTDPANLGSYKYEDDRVTWRAAVNLELPLNRKAQRNVLRNALIEKRRAERLYQENKDLVRLQVRRAMRRIEQNRISLEIQVYNRDLALQRRIAARLRFEKGQVSNREVVDAENELLSARNRLAQAQAQLYLTILQFRRDTGTLRVDDEGKWTRPVEVTHAAVATTQPNG